MIVFLKKWLTPGLDPKKTGNNLRFFMLLGLAIGLILLTIGLTAGWGVLFIALPVFTHLATPALVLITLLAPVGLGIIVAGGLHMGLTILNLFRLPNLPPRSSDSYKTSEKLAHHSSQVEFSKLNSSPHSATPSVISPVLSAPPTPPAFENSQASQLPQSSQVFSIPIPLTFKTSQASAISSALENSQASQLSQSSQVFSIPTPLTFETSQASAISHTPPSRKELKANGAFPVLDEENAPNIPRPTAVTTHGPLDTFILSGSNSISLNSMFPSTSSGSPNNFPVRPSGPWCQNK